MSVDPAKTKSERDLIHEVYSGLKIAQDDRFEIFSETNKLLGHNSHSMCIGKDMPNKYVYLLLYSKAGKNLSGLLS